MSSHRREVARRQLTRFYEEIEAGKQMIAGGRAEVGLLLQRLREEKGWTFREAADIIGCDASSLSKLEKGQKWNQQTAEKAVSIYLG